MSSPHVPPYPHYNPYYQQPPIPYQYPSPPAPVATPPPPPPEKKLPLKYRIIIIGIFVALFASIAIHIYGHFSRASNNNNEYSHLEGEIKLLNMKISDAERKNAHNLKSKEINLSGAKERNTLLQEKLGEVEEKLKSEKEKLEEATNHLAQLKDIGNSKIGSFPELQKEIENLKSSIEKEEITLKNAQNVNEDFSESNSRLVYRLNEIKKSIEKLEQKYSEYLSEKLEAEILEKKEKETPLAPHFGPIYEQFYNDPNLISMEKLIPFPTLRVYFLMSFTLWNQLMTFFVDIWNIFTWLDCFSMIILLQWPLRRNSSFAPNPKF
jgi:hypothetical protein